MLHAALDRKKLQPYRLVDEVCPASFTIPWGVSECERGSSAILILDNFA